MLDTAYWGLKFVYRIARVVTLHAFLILDAPLNYIVAVYRDKGDK